MNVDPSGASQRCPGRGIVRPYARRDVPAPTGAEAAAFDARAIDELGVPQAVLMENAGRAAAAVVQRLRPEGRVVGLVGGGNNGGDALVALRTLAAWGRSVSAVIVADRADDGLLHGWRLDVRGDGDLDDAAWSSLLAPGTVVLDGILGTGISGPPRARQAAAIHRLGDAAVTVVALDVPSGVDAATGAVPGAAVQADVTVAFGAPKLGSLLHPGRARAGRLVAVEIGFPPMEADASEAWLITPVWARSLLPVRDADTHKNAVGRVLIVAGGPGMAGAAVLSVRAALRAGAGLVHVAAHRDNRVVLQTAVPEAVFVDPDDRGAFASALDAADAVAVGPGLGTDDWAEEVLARVLDGPAAPTVLDADALNLAAAGRPTGVAEVARGRPVLVTPHPGEMRRLRPDDAVADRVASALDAAEAWGCAVLLKGAPSLVAADGPVRVDSGGSSDLATAGMGDVLTGVSAALMAQGVAPADAGAVGLWLTGRAAALADRGPGLSPLDVADRLPDAWAERGPGDSDLDLPFVVFDQEAPR